MTGSIRDILDMREKTHGSWVTQASLAQQLKTLLLTDPPANMLPHIQEGVEMICVKLSRIACGNPSLVDHYRDIAGYATLVADALETMPSEAVEKEETPRPPVPTLKQV